MNLLAIVTIGLLGLTLDLGVANGGTLKPKQNNNSKGIDLPAAARNQFERFGNFVGQNINQAGRTFNQAGQAFQGFVSTQHEYMQLIGRYHKWYKEYKLIFEAAKRFDKYNELALLSPSDLLIIIFKQTDNDLFEELQAEVSQTESAEKDGQPSESRRIDNYDYLNLALKKLIERLEALLANIKAASISVKDTSSNANVHLPGEEFKATKEFKEAMERVKQIALKTTNRISGDRSAQLGSVAALNYLATILANRPPPEEGPLSKVAPYIDVLGTLYTPLMATYLTQLRFHTPKGQSDGSNPEA